MKISDIIKKDTDRLFVIDRECFIIYTGTSLNDQRPFIRIGNYIDLPAEIIPFIENIVITDLLIGNPAHEQFNIDIKSLPENRYIGSRSIVNKFLNYQKIFGLDLTNARIVDVEKDIPYLSKEKELSDRDSFIGIFYTDGNFRINHKDTSLLALKDELARAIDDGKLLDSISARSRSSSRYAGAGMLVIGNDPFFYQDKYFTAYHFPKKYAADFARLSVDPQKIQEIIHPSSNFIHITGFLKWQNGRGGRIKIFSDHSEQIETMQRLFSGATISRKDFTGMSHETAGGMSVRNYPGGYNVRLTFRKAKPSGQSLSISYVKGLKGIEAIMKDKVDGIFINYSLFEEANLLLRSAPAPVAVISDNNENIRKLKDAAIPVIHPGLHYEFRAYADAESLMKEILSVLQDYEVAGEPSSQDLTAVKQRFSERFHPADGTFERVRDAVNIMAAVKLLLNATTDRKTSAFLKKLHQEIDSMVDRLSLGSQPGEGFTVVLAFCSGAIVEFIRKAEPADTISTVAIDSIDESARAEYEKLDSAQEREFYLRILHDRRRLLDLLRLYIPGRDDAGMSELKAAIEERKKQYYADETEFPQPESAAPPKFNLKRAAGIITVIVSLAVSGAIIRTNVDTRRVERERERAAVEKRVRQELINKYEITVTATDIFRYANEVALANGYHPIAMEGIKDKNPNWIYPGNVFTLNGGEKVVVRQGDTLWEIAHERLIDRNIVFYRVIERIKGKIKSGADITADISEAEKAAFNEKHRSLLDAVRGEASGAGRRKGDRPKQ